MPVTVVLAIGFDPWVFESQRAVWQSAGHFVSPTGDVNEAISHFRDGDFDAVLLGGSLPPASRERIISLIRSSGSSVPVLCASEPSGNCQACEFAAGKSEPEALMQKIKELLADPLRKPATNVTAGEGANSQVPERFRAVPISRSGVKRRSKRASQFEIGIERQAQSGLAGNACFTICFKAGNQASRHVGGAMELHAGPPGPTAI